MFYGPTDPDHISYVGAENLSLDGSTVTGNALVTAFIVPITVTFDSATGTIGSLQIEGSH